MTITWIIKSFDQLSNIELYQALQLRLEVFSVEQNVAYQDADSKDLQAFHILGYNAENELIAYARVLPAGLAYKELSIGRVVTSHKVRGTGAGRELFKKSMEFVNATFGNVPIRISAQSYLIKFYSSFDFRPYGEEYLEDSLPHTGMFREAE